MEQLGLILAILAHFLQVFYFDQFLVELELEVLNLMLEVQMRLLSLFEVVDKRPLMLNMRLISVQNLLLDTSELKILLLQSLLVICEQLLLFVYFLLDALQLIGKHLNVLGSNGLLVGQFFMDINKVDKLILTVLKRLLQTEFRLLKSNRGIFKLLNLISLLVDKAIF